MAFPNTCLLILHINFEQQDAISGIASMRFFYLSWGYWHTISQGTPIWFFCPFLGGGGGIDAHVEVFFREGIGVFHNKV